MKTKYDVAIVGFGPAGQTLAALLGARGVSVGVFERHLDVYPLPRAVRLDGEVVRIFQEAGIVDQIAHELYEPNGYLWYGADGEIILNIETNPTHPSGWADTYMFYQPVIERALCDAATAHESVDVHRGVEFVGLGENTADTVTFDVRPVGTAEAATTIEAKYLVGADGANSAVRQAAGLEWDDLGFDKPWLVVDFVPNDIDDFAHLPDACQFCDPVRPTTAVRNGTRLRRWEFMLLEGEQPSDYETEEQTWTLLKDRVDPSLGEIERHAVYTFQSKVVNQMRDGNVFLAGDSAHVMPPFMGEGMCSGIRDAANLAWKLDRVLDGRSSPALLDSYHSERYPQNRVIIETSLFMGQVSCTLDPEEAAGRDAAFRSGAVPPPPGFPPLSDGVVRDDASDPIAGTKAVQGTVITDGSSEFTDERFGRGLRLLTTDASAAQAALDAGGLGDVTVIDLRADDVDSDGAVAAWLEANGVVAVLVRPDHYVFGSCGTADDVPALVGDLVAHLA